MSALTIENREGILLVRLNLENEPVNKITAGVRDEMESFLHEFQGDSSAVAAVLISTKEGSFIAGADIDEFQALRSQKEAEDLVREGQELINRFEDCGKPVVAAIHGACLGGGYEAALACAYRIATDHDKTRIGLPEIQLGIIPAAGGCQRLPRLIGIRSALDIILPGKTVPARRAHRNGMIDELVHPAILEDVAMDAARRLAGGWRPERKPSLIDRALQSNPLGRAVVFRQARSKVREKSGDHYPAPFKALEAIEHGLAHGIRAGLDREARYFAELAVSDVSRKLVQIFFSTNELKKDLGVAGRDVRPRDIRSVGVVGAGFMGSSIGGVAVAQAKVDVRFREPEWEDLVRGLRHARSVLDDRKKRRRITRYEHRELVALISGSTDYSGFRLADLVIEAVFEDLNVKHDVFRELQANTRGDCVLASNTSTIPISRIAEVVDSPERVLGMHFFSPVEKMPLLEVIVTDATSDEATATAVAFGRKMGKTVIVVRDRPGFWVNRILAPYLNESGRLLREGLGMERIDRIMKGFGFPVGPVTLLDEVGLDVGLKASRVLREEFGDRLEPVPGLDRLVEDGRLGRKSGKGFYSYEDGKRKGPDEEAVKLLGGSSDGSADEDEARRRMVFSLLNEAARAYSEGVVKSPRDADIGAIFGIGYPPFLGGPMRYMDDLGAREVVDTLEKLAAKVGERFSPAPILEEMASSGRGFYSES